MPKNIFAFFVFSLLALVIAQPAYAGGGPVEFTIEPNTSLNPGEQYVVNARVYADGPYPTYCKGCYIKLAFQNPQEGDYIAQDSETTNEDGRIYAKVISKVSGERIIIVSELKNSNGTKIDAGSYAALRYTGESQFLKTPTNLRITQIETTNNSNTRKVHIFWDPVPGATSYTVYKPMSGINFYETTVDTNLYEMNVSTSSVFYIAVAARKGTMESARSEILTIDLAKDNTSNNPNPTSPPATINAWILRQNLVGQNSREVTIKWGAFGGNSGTFTIYAKPAHKNDWDEKFDGSKGPSAAFTIKSNQDYHVKVYGCMDKFGTCVDSNILLLPKIQEKDGTVITGKPVESISSVPSENNQKVEELNQKVASLEGKLAESQKKQSVLEQRIGDLVNFIKRLFPFFN